MTPPLPAPALAAWAGPSLRTTLAKLALCGLGMGLLGAISHSASAALALLATGLLSHAAGRWLRLRPKGRVHRWVGRGAVPLAFLAVVLLNMTGLIGTLTGGGSTLQAGASPLMVAMPFYLLAAAAFLVEMSAQRASMPLPRLLDFMVYLMLPFKLLAGPLETPQLMRQIETFRARLSGLRLVAAWPWLVMGAFMKYVIANRLDPARHLVETGPVASFATAAVFELKFYFDFAGYSFMAYGACLALGLRISANFAHPFFAPNVVLFWRCWHMSLGRFLGRYVLEPNLSLWKGRHQKMLFASAIFMVSAMWHGGTLNYLAWGLFHGACYFAYGQWLRRREVPAWLGVLAMLLFFVFGRMLAVDADGARLLARLAGFFDPGAYTWAPAAVASFLSGPEWRALAVAALFLGAEYVNTRRHRGKPYHLLRRPVATLTMLVLFLLAGTDDGALLYARI